MLAQRRRWAVEEGLDPDFVEGLYRGVVFHFVERETDDWRRVQPAPDPPAC